jgi:uncharacterized protein YndB with AHSA1/START domain
MTTQPATTVGTADLEELTYTVERTFAAPRERVFRAWTDCEALAQWWGPKGWSLPFCEIDFRPGGTWRYMMRGEGPNGTMDAWGKAVYTEIVAPERIVYQDFFTDADGNVSPGMPEMTIEVDFIAEGDATRLFSVSRFQRAEDIEMVLRIGMEEGLKDTWDRLEAYVTA